MSERCPLSGGGRAIEKLPEFCMKNCYDLWDRVRREQQGYIDVYPAQEGEDLCVHENYGVATSHEGLQAIDASDYRSYSIVDMCEGCKAELMETDYSFNCPHN